MANLSNTAIDSEYMEPQGLSHNIECSRHPENTMTFQINATGKKVHDNAGAQYKGFNIKPSRMFNSIEKCTE